MSLYPFQTTASSIYGTPPPPRPVDQMIQHPVFLWVTGGTLLFILQVVTGVDISFGVLTFGVVVTTGVTFHLLGGVRRLPALCILLLGLQHVLIAQIAKLFFGDPADEPLTRPHATMAVYLIGMCSLLVGAVLIRHWRILEIRPIFRPDDLFRQHPARLLLMSVVAIALATLRVAIIFKYALAESGDVISGGFVGPVKTMIFLGPFSVALSTAYVLHVSGGKRSLGPLNAVALLPTMIFGILGAYRSEAGMSIVIYILTCLAFGYRFRLKHYATLAAGAWIFVAIISPYALLARSIVRTPNPAENIRLAVELFVDATLNPAKYHEQLERNLQRLPPSYRQRLYYGEAYPILDRFSVLMWVDAIVDATLDDGTTGMETVTPGFEMLLPRFLNPDKPVYGTANMLAHRTTGLVGPTDFKTQITLGLFADSFSSFGWVGVALIPMCALVLMTLVYQKLTGTSLYRNPYTLAFSMWLPWMFSENTIQSTTLLIFQQPLVVLMMFSLVQLLALLLSPFLPQLRFLEEGRNA